MIGICDSLRLHRNELVHFIDVQAGRGVALGHTAELAAALTLTALSWLSRPRNPRIGNRSKPVVAPALTGRLP